jgi:ammonium transporter, Amt family
VKRAFGYDDSLDVFGVHAVGGIIGAILTGVFAATSLGGVGFGEGNTTVGGQVIAQLIAVGATVLFTAIMSFIILKIIDMIIGLRVDEEQEAEGLDIALHEERG